MIFGELDTVLFADDGEPGRNCLHGKHRVGQDSHLPPQRTGLAQHHHWLGTCREFTTSNGPRKMNSSLGHPRNPPGYVHSWMAQERPPSWCKKDLCVFVFHFLDKSSWLQGIRGNMC
jgi:hypothetical protein